MNVFLHYDFNIYYIEKKKEFQKEFDAIYGNF
jgi:hypothetical protein